MKVFNNNTYPCSTKYINLILIKFVCLIDQYLVYELYIPFGIIYSIH